MGKSSATPLLTVVVNFFNNRREARNTLHSLTRAYQRGTRDLAYEVIALDHGSSEPLDEKEVRAFGPEFSYRYVHTRAVSPAAAINEACFGASGERLLVLIDGAHIVSPGVLRLATEAFQLFASPFIATVPFHLGPKRQNESVLEGYNQQTEDALLARSGWKEDGYRLFAISAWADRSEGWFGMLYESGCFGIRRSDFEALGGFDERFQSPGGGLVNLDFFRRAVSIRDLQYTMLVGEASFHQFHGGVASNAPQDRHPWEEFHREYVRIRGGNYTRVWRRPFLLGKLPPQAFHIAKLSASRAFELWESKPLFED